MTNVFTIVSCNYLAEARMLMDSVKEFLPEAGRTVFFIDDWAGKFDPAAEDFECVAAWKTSMPRYRHFAFAYSPGEFCFALKPFCARYLFDHTPAQSLIYVDSDMLFLARPDALLESLRGHPIVLAPHKLRAAEKTEHFNIVRAGAFNAGFFAVSRSAQADEFLRWWGEQMIEPGNMTQDWFFDQGWLDLVPSYFAGTEILRHPGYNVAFWNLIERRVSRSGALDSEAGDRRPEIGGNKAETGDRRPEARGQSERSEARGGEALADPKTKRLRDEEPGGARRPETQSRANENTTNGWRVEFGGEEYPLVLFHFSMFDHRFPDRISGEIDYAGTGPNADLDALIREYVGRLKDWGLESCHRWRYDHGAFADGKPVTKSHREFFKKRCFHDLSRQADPFDPVMQPKTLGSLYNVDHPLARLVRSMRGTVKGY
jgi:hypothetical protein